MRTCHAIWAVHRRNIKLLIRKQQLVAQSIVVPLVVLCLSAFVLGSGGDAWPVALINRSDSAAAQQLTTAITDSQSNISPYFRLLPMPALQAEARVRAGRLQMMIEIPDDFADTNTIVVHTYNINSDAMKNLRLRLQHALNRSASNNEHLAIVPHLVTARPEDVWRSGFLGGSSVLLALFFGATLIAANLFALEREGRTHKEMLLTPLGPATAGAGIVVSAVLASLVTSMPTLFVAMTFFNLVVDPGRLAVVYAAMLPVLIGCAGLGILLGHLLGHFRTIQPVVIVTAIATFFVGGGFVGVAMLPPVARSLAEIWVFSRIFEWFNPVLHGFVPGFSPTQYLSIFGTGFLGMLLLAFSYQREPQRQLGGGQ